MIGKYIKPTQRDFSNSVLRNRVSHLAPRKKKIPLVRGILIVGALAAAVIIFIPGLQENDAEATPERTLPAVNLQAAAVDTNPSFTGIVAYGSTFYLLLAKYGVTQAASYRFYQKLKETGFQNFTAGDSFIVVKNRKGGLKQFSLRTSQRVWFKVSEHDSQVTAMRIDPHFRVEEKLVTGTLEGNLYETVIRLGEGPELVSLFVDIFQWDINFFLDPRQGDRFEILIEKIYDDTAFVRYGRILGARYTGALKSSDAYLFALGSQLDYFDGQGGAVRKMFLKAPLHFSRISSRFSLRRFHPVLHVYRAHPAVDYAAAAGSPVYAAADGRVEYAEYRGGYGKCICLNHGNGLKTYYGHLSGYGRGIYGGTRVTQSQCIGYVGSTGLASGAHLDYRFQRGGRYVNPLTVESPRNIAVPDRYRMAFAEYKQRIVARLEGKSFAVVAQALYAGGYGYQRATY